MTKENLRNNMITASIVLFKTKHEDVKKILFCAAQSNIDYIYVIDNSPNDDLNKIVASYSTNDRVSYIFGQGNIGYGKAHNIAIKKAIDMGAKYHVVLNPDIYFEEGVLESIESFMDKHQEIGYLLPNVTYPNGEQQFLCKTMPTPIDILGRKILPKCVANSISEQYEMRNTEYNKTRNIPILSGCFMYMRVSVLQKIGLFDDRFFMYFEDFDLIRRIGKVSKTVFYPKVSIVHNHAAEHRTNKVLFKISMNSAIKYFNKWGWLIDPYRWKINRKAFKDCNIIED